MAALPVNLLAVSTYFEGVEILSCLRFQPVNDGRLGNIMQLTIAARAAAERLDEAVQIKPCQR